MRDGSMKLRARLASILAIVLLGTGSGPLPPGTDRVEFEKAAKTILCDCGCHPQSVFDCACGRAEEMRQEIAAEIRAGKSGEEVIGAYVARYGEQVQIAPTARGFNLVAWLGPLLLLLVSTAGVLLLLRRWRGAQAREEPVERPGPDPDDPYLARLRKDLEEHP